MAAPTPHQAPLLPDDPPSPVQLATQAFVRPRDGHWDELHGHRIEPGEPLGAIAPKWEQFWCTSGVGSWAELDTRLARVKSRVQEDGASYNVYEEDSDGSQAAASHVWPLELLPLLIDAKEWRGIETGVQQWARLLNATLADLYGPRSLLAQGLLPASLVLAHPQYLRPLQGCAPPGGVHIHVLALDLARGPDGNWWVVAQRTQAPSGLGYMLENRLIIAEQFPDAFRDMKVQRLAGAYRSLLQGLMRLAQPMAEAGETPRVALLTPGPRNETYFEHAFLARYLGIALVEGGDLTVRDNRVYLKTLHGLERVHALLRRVDDEYLDPLELRADSQLGVPGLVQALRAQQVVVANAPGAGWLESPGLAGFWPGVAKALLGESLLLPSSNGWWCGEESAWLRHREQLSDFIVAPTFPSSETTRGFAPFPASELDAAALLQLQARIQADPTAHTLKERVRPAKQPVWRSGQLEPRASVLRVFALCDGQGGWTVLPGGLTRVAERRAGAQDALLTMQSGCASVDTWVQTDGNVDRSSLLPPPLQPTDLGRSHRTVTSRAAENLFWLGRYTERAENSVRLARLTLAASSATSRGTGPTPMLQMLDAMAHHHGLVGPSCPNALQAPRRFEQQLMLQLGDPTGTSVAHNLRALAQNAQSLRERLSTEHWQLIHRLSQDFDARFAIALPAGEAEIVSLLGSTDARLSALTGAQSDRMTRDDGWRLLSVGRQIERLHFLADALQQGFKARVAASDEGFALLLALFDSTITYRAQFQSRREVPPLLHLLVMDHDNPRSLAWVARTMRDRFRKLARHEPVWSSTLAAQMPNPDDWSLAALAQGEPDYPALQSLLDECGAQALSLSLQISQRLFAHVETPERRIWQ